jgi:imidazole glycerol-phosphate synthase subunit HisH
MNIVVVNTGVGNVRAIPNMLRRLGASAEISDEARVVDKADCIILPGVGSYDSAVRYFEQTGLKDILNQKAGRDNVPTLGICLGMQLMAEGSEEGREPGFGWIPGRLKRFQPQDGKDKPIRVPHMGWNIVEDIEGEPLYAGMRDEARFYFDHSYYWQPENQDSYCGVAEYGIRFAAGVKRGNLYGVQFHPEKSHRFGLQMFSNFLTIAEKAISN